MKFTYLLLLLIQTQSIKSQIYDYIEKSGIRNPDIVYQQSVYETGYFKSKNFKLNNNLFGFRTKRGYIKYKSWTDCIDYYKKWQEKRYLDTTENYYHFLNRINYCGCKNFNYAEQLKKIKI